jgi:hypothetical protein
MLRSAAEPSRDLMFIPICHKGYRVRYSGVLSQQRFAVRKFVPLVLFLLGAANLHAVDRKLDGVWKAVFTGPTGERPKMVSEMVFIFRVDVNKLTGIAHMSYWPGDTEISDGKVDSDRISFTALGKLPWASTSNGLTQGG